MYRILLFETLVYWKKVNNGTIQMAESPNEALDNQVIVY